MNLLYKRKSIRLKEYDYTQLGLYFITICCQNKEMRFGNIEKDKMLLNDFDQIAYHQWLDLANRFSNFELDVFVIMPNHIHGIIFLKEDGDKRIGDIVGTYKSLVSIECLKLSKSRNEIMGKLWQRNFYEHIIRDERGYQNIKEYILNNSSKWNIDCFLNSRVNSLR